jgi:MFS family permease
MGLLVKAGRRTLMLWTNLAIAIDLVVLGYLSLQGSETPVIILIMVFICLFEFGPGPICWLYMSEIMQDKAVSIATVINWLVNLVISACIPGIITAIGDDNIGWIFIVMGILTAFGFIFIIFFMVETMGKTPQQIEEMFAGNHKNNGDRNRTVEGENRQLVNDSDNSKNMY